MAHGLSSCGSQALERRLSSCGARASLLCSMWDLPGPGLKPVSPALAGGFLTTAPPGKPTFYYLKENSKAIWYRSTAFSKSDKDALYRNCNRKLLTLSRNGQKYFRQKAVTAVRGSGHHQMLSSPGRYNSGKSTCIQMHSH